VKRRRRILAPSLVLTIALAPACTRGSKTKTGANETGDDVEKSWTEFRDGRCRVVPDCSPPPGENFNPCNPPPPEQIVDCPPALLPTQPPDTSVTKSPDGTCWVDCTDATCDAAGPLRVSCPAEGAPPPTYAKNVVVPAAKSARYDTGVFHRLDDMTCTLVECEAGTKCETPPGRTFTNVPCPPELVPKVATGVVPVMSSKSSMCFYGKFAVECPKRFHVWH
jgi:hypothetical protein